MTESMHRIEVVTKLPRSVPRLLSRVRAILASMEQNPWFPGPTPAPAVVSALAELALAQTAALSRTRGTTAVRDGKQAAVMALVEQLRLHVQRVADGSPESARAIIESAGMSVKRSPAPTKPPFAVKRGPTSGSVQLVVRAAGDRAAYLWAWSTDGGVEWHDAPATTQARTVVAGLPVGKACSFRVRVVTKDGEHDPSAPVSWIVV